MSVSFFKWSLILFPFFLYSCNGHEPSAYEKQLSAITDTISRASFSKTDTLQFEKTGFIVEDVYSMAITDTFILLAPVQSTRALTILSSKSYKPLAEIIPKDKGKGHLLSVQSIMNTPDKDVVWLYDGTGVKLLKVDLQKAIRTDNYEGEKELTASNPASGVWSAAFINDSTYAGCPLYSGEERFIQFNDSFQPLKKMGVLPPSLPDWPRENPTGKISLRAICYSGMLVKHPEKDKYAIAYSGTSRIDLYDSSRLVKVIRGPDLFDPLFKFQDRGTLKLPDVYKETSINCIALQADNKYIYMLYSGRKKRVRFGRQLLIFDWNGKPVKWYDLPDTYKNFAITHKGDHTLIYALRYKANDLEYADISL